MSHRKITLGFNTAFNLLYLVHFECLGRRAVDHRSGGDVEAGAVALTHNRRPCEQASGERARLMGATASTLLYRAFSILGSETNSTNTNSTPIHLEL